MEKDCQPPHQSKIGGGGRKGILSQLFDVKPMKETGDLDMERIIKIKKTLNLRGELTNKENKQRKEAVRIPVIPYSRDMEDYVLILNK